MANVTTNKTYFKVFMVYLQMFFVLDVPRGLGNRICAQPRAA